MNKSEINSKLNQLAENEEKINKEAETFIQLREKLIFFMKANNITKLESEGITIDLSKEE